MLTRLGTSKTLLQLMKANFSGAVHIPYDWRDDHEKNTDFYQDSRLIGNKHPLEY